MNIYLLIDYNYAQNFITECVCIIGGGKGRGARGLRMISRRNYPGLRGGSRIYKRGGRLTQGTNLLGRVKHAGTRGAWGNAPPPRKFLKNRC